MNTIENVKRLEIVELAKENHHKPYIHTDHGPNSFDCAGLVWYVYNKILNIDIYENGKGGSTTGKIMNSSYGKIAYFNDGIKILKQEDFKLGDILLFHCQSPDATEPREDNKYPGHAGIYIGKERFIHCTSKCGKVVISNYNKPNWNKLLIAKKDIFDDEKVKQLIN